MKADELLCLLEKIGPLSLSRELCSKYGYYDNSGIIVDCGEEITGVLFSLDLSRGALEEAKRRRLNAIVTHHPAIYGGIENISVTSPSTSLIADCIRWGISVISMHLNFDAAPEGIDYHLMLGLGGEAADIMQKLSCGAYGRVYDITPRRMADYADYVGQRFSSRRIIFYGDENRIIRRVASFCGAGADDEAIAFAKEKGADLFVSSDIKHHVITALSANGMNVMQLTHYASENYGFKAIYIKITEGLNVPAAYYCDAGLL